MPTGAFTMHELYESEQMLFCALLTMAGDDSQRGDDDDFVAALFAAAVEPFTRRLRSDIPHPACTAETSTL